jgi:hypothetical protein
MGTGEWDMRMQSEYNKQTRMRQHIKKQLPQQERERERGPDK